MTRWVTFIIALLFAGVGALQYVGTATGQVARTCCVEGRLDAFHEVLVAGHVTDLDVEDHIRTHSQLPG